VVQTKSTKIVAEVNRNVQKDFQKNIVLYFLSFCISWAYDKLEKKRLKTQHWVFFI